MFFRPARALLLLLALAAAAGLCGCASTSLKGTPFYTGEYEKRNGPAEDRVNLWPLLYYRDPALSVLWPVAEHTDDHVALRPLFSIYRLHEPRKEYNVLWPLAQFDRHAGENRIFPVYWGDDYASVFPLYWHVDDPFDSAGEGVDALFPLWLYFNGRGPDYSLHLLWPLYNRKHDGDTEGWRLWPLYADWRRGATAYEGWYAWPLGWRWGDSNRHSRLLLPLFYQESAPASSTFMTILGGRSETGGDLSWYALPALAWGSRSGLRQSIWAGGPLYHYERDADSSASHLLPFYYRSQTPSDSLFVSLPFSRHRDAAGSWNLIPPLWFNHRDEAGSITLTPLYMWGTEAGTGKPWSAIPPVYYHRDTELGDTFLSPLYSTWTGARRTRHTLLPPGLAYYRSAAARNDLWALAGLAHFSWGEARGSSYLFPLFYENERRDVLLSPFYSSWGDSGTSGRVTLVPPLLSWADRRDSSASLYLLLGLAKFSGGDEPEDSWLFPVYYRNPAAGQFLSPVYARWGLGDDSGFAIPLLLSSYSTSATERDLRLLALFGRSWSTRPDGPSSSWLVPLYAAGDDYFFTPLAGRIEDSATTFTYFPTPLFGWRSGATRGSWLVPVYFYSRNVESNERNLFYLLWGRYHADASGSSSSLFPFYGYENANGTSWHILYVAAYENRARPLTRWDRAAKTLTRVGTEDRASNRFFPVWRYERTVDSQTRLLEKEFSLLFFLQDYWRKKDLSEKAATDYTRTRVLWRLVHYERDHESVSLDVFPAITYDRTGQSRRKVSFLWRGFRYERKEEQKAVDVLFLPVWRSRWGD
jgi:hypothetical protein